MATANLKSVVSVDTTRFEAGMRRVGSGAKITAVTASKSFRKVSVTMQQVAISVANFAKKLATVSFASIIGGAAALGAGLKKAFDLGGSLSDLSAKTDIAVKDLVVLKQAFEDAGVSGDQVGITLNRLTRRTLIATEGNNNYAKALEKLGLDPVELSLMDQAERFKVVAQRIGELGINSTTTAAAMDLMDTSAGDLFGLFQDSDAFEVAAQRVGSAASLLEKNAETFDSIADILNTAGDRLGHFFVGVGDVVAPKVLAVLERFDKLDFAGIGLRFAKGLNLENALNLMKLAFDAAASFLGDAILKGFIRAVKGLHKMWTSFVQQMADNIAGVIMGANQPLIDLLTNPIGMAKKVRADGFADTFWKSVQKGAGVVDFSFISDPIKGLFDTSGKAGKFIDALKDVMSKGAQAVDGTLTPEEPEPEKPEPEAPPASAKEFEPHGPPAALKSRPRKFGEAGSLQATFTGLADRTTARKFGEAGSLQATFTGLADRTTARKFGEAGSLQPGPNVFEENRKKLGLASGLVDTGGLGATRAVGSRREEQEQRAKSFSEMAIEKAVEQITLLGEQNELLRQGLAV